MFPQVGHERCAQNYQVFEGSPESPERPDRPVPKHNPFPARPLGVGGAVSIQVRGEVAQGGVGARLAAARLAAALAITYM